MSSKIGERVYGTHGGMRKWIASRILGNRGKILDFGCDSYAPLGQELARRGFLVTAIDLLPCKIEKKEKSLDYIQGDITELEFPERNFNYIINCSSIEHAGLIGRYGSKDEPDQDLWIMELFKRLLKKDGLYLAMIPVGIEAVIKPLHRIYGRNRFSQLIEGWSIVEKEFWNFDLESNWYRTTEQKAFEQIPRTQYPQLTARAMYVLKLK